MILTKDDEGILKKLSEEIFKMHSLHPKLTEAKSNLSLTGVSSRNYFYWKKSGLVGKINDNKGFNGKEKVRLNLFDYVWLRTVSAMREFGIPIITIKALKEEMFKSVFDEIEEFLVKKRDSDEIDHEKKAMAELSLKFKEIFEGEYKPLITTFGSLLNRALLLNDRVSFITYVTDGVYVVEIHLSSNEVMPPKKPSWQNEPHLIIPLNKFINEFMEEPNNEDNLVFWSFLSRDEKKLLDEIRQKQFKEIRINRKSESGEVQIEVINDKDITEDKAREICRIFGLNKYSEVTLKYRNDKHVYLVEKRIK